MPRTQFDPDQFADDCFREDLEMQVEFIDSPAEVDSTGWLRKGVMSITLDEDGDVEISGQFLCRINKANRYAVAEINIDSDYDNPTWRMYERLRTSNSSDSYSRPIYKRVSLTAGTHLIELWFQPNQTNATMWMSGAYVKAKRVL